MDTNRARIGLGTLIASLVGLAAVSLAATPAYASSWSPEVEALRSACQKALAAEAADGRPHDSRTPCHAAAKATGMPEDMRNEVRALVNPTAHPSLEDLGVALMLVEAAVNKAANQPWGHLARCDVAERLGNAAALTTCLADMDAMARKHPASQQALATLRYPASPPVWLGRIGLGLLFVATLIHAGRGWRRRRAQSGRQDLPATPAAASTIALVALFAVAGPARADELPKIEKDHLGDIVIDDANPEASVPDLETQNRKPLQFGYFLQDLGGKAEAAVKRGDHAAAARYFKALATATPKSAFGPRQLCLELEAAGDIAGAVVACRTAITREGATIGDYERFVAVALARKTALAPLERKEIAAVVAHVESESPGATANRLRCDLAVRVSDRKALEACTAALVKLAPDDPQTVSYQWALAMLTHDKGKATELIGRARQLGMSVAGVSEMKRATDEMATRNLVRIAVGVLTALVAAVALYGFWSWNNRRRGLPLPAGATPRA
jgi:hypothetical protein